jgi:hypothetical protein
MNSERSKVTIEHLQVELEVDGDDASVFERMFHRCIEQWSRGERQRERDAQRLESARSIGGGHRGRGGSP